MIKRDTWIVLGVFALLLFAALVINKQSPPEDDLADLIADQPVYIFFDVQPQQVIGLEIASADGQRVSLEKDEDNVWQALQPAALEEQTDTARIDSALGGYLFLRQTIAIEPISALQTVGLDKPAYTITLILNDTTHRSLAIGNDVLNGQGYYVQLENNPPQVVNTTQIDTLIGFLDDPPVFAPTEEPVTGETPAP